MKFFLLFIVSFSSYCQHCRERFFQNNEKAAILEYADEAVRNRYFMGDIGVIFINESTIDSRIVWDVRMIYDEGIIEQNVPHTYAYVNNFLVLFGNYSLKVNKEEVLTCMEKVILDRLYIRPQKTERLMIIREGPFRDSPPLHPVPRMVDARNPVYTDGDRTARRIIYNGAGEIVYSGKNTTIMPR